MRINNYFIYCLLLFTIFFQFCVISKAASLDSQIIQTKIYKEYKTNGLEKAEAEYKSLNSKNNLTETDVIALLSIYDKNTDDDKYIDLCKSGINKFLKSYTIYCLLGMKYADLKKYDDAIAAYTKSIEICPTEPSYYNRGQIYYFIKKDYKRAINDFSEAIKYIEQYSNKNQAKKALADIYKNRAFAYNQLEKYDNAISDFDLSISYEQENANLYYDRAVIKIAKVKNGKIPKKERANLIHSANKDLDRASDIYKKNNNMIMYKKIQNYRKIETVKSVIK